MYGRNRRTYTCTCIYIYIIPGQSDLTLKNFQIDYARLNSQYHVKQQQLLVSQASQTQRESGYMHDPIKQAQFIVQSTVQSTIQSPSLTAFHIYIYCATSQVRMTVILVGHPARAQLVILYYTTHEALIMNNCFKQLLLQSCSIM